MQKSEAQQKRKYQVIWDTLKEKQRCTIEVHPNLCARVKKAVIKEKNQDLGFKLLNDHDYFYLKVEKKIKKPGELVVMTFVLKQRYGLDGIHK